MVKKLPHDEYVARLYKINPNIEVLDEYAGIHTNILHRCKLDKYEWYVCPDSILHGHGCPVCYGNDKKTHDKYIEDVSKINLNIEVVGRYINAKTDILHRCKIDGYEWMSKPNNILNGFGCPVCANRAIGQAPDYKNSIWSSKYKDYFSKYMTEEQMKVHMPYSNKKVDVICPDCKRHKLIEPSQLLRRGLGCQCGDGISYPNKFVYSVLNQLGIEFISEYAPEWSDKKQYDVFIPSINCIIENHGAQHYTDVLCWNNRTLEEEKRNDEYKKMLAIENGIRHYIVINCSCSTESFIKQSILNSELPVILNFTEQDINWIMCDKYASSNVVKIVAELWNNGLSIKQIIQN
ncbi:MAG: hypothetical protein ACI4TK_11270, partial [Agathobacter sp.]